MKYLLLSLVCITAFSCTSPEVKKGPQLFDLHAYFEKNIHDLDSLNPTVSKKVETPDTSENFVDSALNWKKELKIFTELKWNQKLAYQYKIDSSVSGLRLRIQYTALDSNLEIQSFFIEKLTTLSDRNARLKITRKINKDVYSIDQELYFEPLSGYYIKGKQSVPFVYDENYNIFSSWTL